VFVWLGLFFTVLMGVFVYYFRFGVVPVNQTNQVVKNNWFPPMTTNLWPTVSTAKYPVVPVTYFTDDQKVAYNCANGLYSVKEMNVSEARVFFNKDFHIVDNLTMGKNKWIVYELPSEQGEIQYYETTKNQTSYYIVVPSQQLYRLPSADIDPGLVEILTTFNYFNGKKIAEKEASDLVLQSEQFKKLLGNLNICQTENQGLDRQEKYWIVKIDYRTGKSPDCDSVDFSVDAFTGYVTQITQYNY
jgi:hypothetical protein